MWDAAQDQTLTQNWGVIACHLIAERLGTSKTEIFRRAVKIGLKPLSNPRWTAEKDQQLRDLWGTMSCVAAAERLGVTKNAVIGRARRLGLEKLQSITPGRPRTNRPRRERKAAEIKRPKYQEFESPLVAVEPLNILFGDLAPHHCREIVGQDGWQSLSCGHPRIHESSYCRWHHAINHVPRAERA